jgi:hypothetical protein
VLCELVAGGAPPKLRADKAAALLRTVHPVTAADRARKQVAWELVAEVRGLDRQLAVINNGSMTPSRHSAAGSPRPWASARSSPAGCLAAPVGPRASPPRRTSPATSAPLRSRSPAASTPDTGCLAPVTGSATMPCTSWRSSRLAAQAAPATTTSDASSPRQDHPGSHALPQRRIADHVWRVMLADEQARDQLNLQAI